MSEITSFIFGILYGIGFGALFTLVYVQSKKHPCHIKTKNGYTVINPNPNRVFYGYQAEGKLNLSNPPRGGSCLPPRK